MSAKAARSAKAIAQNIQHPDSYIARVLRELNMPQDAFNPVGEWSHTYIDGSSFFALGRVQGTLKIKRDMNGALHIVNSRPTVDRGYRFFTIARLESLSDELSTPRSWEVHSKIAADIDAPAYLNTGLHKRFKVENGLLSIASGAHRQTLTLKGRYTCKHALLDAVQRLPGADVPALKFTMLDEYDQPCPDQRLRLRCKTKATFKNGTGEVYVFDQIGFATVPATFCVDSSGRLLAYVAGMQSLILYSENGIKTGYADVDIVE